LKEQYEPATKKELYQAQFYARRKQKAEDWEKPKIASRDSLPRIARGSP
jgi:hypothetical protein